MSTQQSRSQRKITAADAVKILKKEGREVTEKDAENILEMMYFLAKFIVNQNFKI